MWDYSLGLCTEFYVITSVKNILGRSMYRDNSIDHRFNEGGNTRRISANNNNKIYYYNNQ